MSDYEWHVQLAAKGMAERDNHPMPKSVNTPEAFYEVMAAAALDFMGFPALLERVARAERELEIIQEALGRADAKAKNARHQPMTYEADFSVSSFASILPRGEHGPRARRNKNRRPGLKPLVDRPGAERDCRRTAQAVSGAISTSPFGGN